MKLIENIAKFYNYSHYHGLTQAFRKGCEKMRNHPFLKKSRRDVKPGELFYQCNICGGACWTRFTELTREEPSCHRCSSTVRMRAMVNLLSMELFGESLSIPDFPVRADISGVGMSDWDGYARPLATKFNYRNTFYHKEPKLDITSIPSALEESLDFIISSDVYEHIVPPVSIAFENARKLLKPNGVFIFIVPYNKNGSTKEHFPDLFNYEVRKENGNYTLRNISRNGTEQVFDNLVFHGGMGATLEMRSFTETSLLDEFRKAGFSNVKVYNEPCYEFGIVWEHDWSLPIAARIK
jgi:hypothetical protein